MSDEAEVLVCCQFCDWGITPGPHMLRDENGDLYPVSWAFAQLHILEQHPDEARQVVKDPEFEAIVLAEQLKDAGFEVVRRQ